MNLEKYYNLEGSKLSFTRQQASDFAKTIAGDFNTIHDTDSKRFCVPGDLLFAVIVNHYGLRQTMGLSFSGMVGDDVTLILPEVNAREISIYDENDKKYLDVSTNGELTDRQSLIDSLTLEYAKFSGHTFPHILVPLMQENNVMINTERPLVIYDHMRIALDTLDIDTVEITMSDRIFRLYGKRGFAQYQCVLPSEVSVYREFLEIFQRGGGASFVSVLKDCGEAGPGPLSFLQPGASMALDIPIRKKKTPELIARLNEFVIAHGGRMYLAKDAFSTAEHFRAMYPRLPEFEAIRRKWDPERRLSSALSRRLFE